MPDAPRRDHGAKHTNSDLFPDVQSHQRFSFVFFLPGYGMKRDWFYQDNLTEEQAEELVARYRANNITVEKSLDVDPRFWVVSAFLPVSDRHQRTQRSMCSRGWK